MSLESEKLYIPPFASVRLIECREHFQLVPVPAVRVFFGYGKMKASDFANYPDENAPPFHEFCEPGEEIWIVVQLYRFEDGHEERGNCCYLRSPPATEDDARKRMREMEDFDNTTREELLALTQTFRAKEEDYQYIEDKHPNYQEEPDPSDTEKYDVYHARLKVMEELQPKTVALIKIANATKDPVKRQFVEREAVQSFFAELAHYLTEAEVLAWQRSNPVGTGWMCEFGEVMREPRRQLDPINHELALNWLRAHYNRLTAKDLSNSIFSRVWRWLAPGFKLTADFIKKRRERLGLTTKRPPGPPPKPESQ
jgi:hypothetical protein